MSENGGEKELVLGNKQLLAIFFVATLLCGVFFAMGYVVGGNSAKSNAASVADASSPVSTEGKRPEPKEDPRDEPKAPPATTVTGATSASGDTGSSLPAPEPRLADNPAAGGSQPPEVTNAAPAPAQSTVAQTVHNALASPAAAPPVPARGNTPDSGSMVVSVPSPGASYVQVAAEPRPNADVLVKVLRERGLPAILAESPKPPLYRVLVGPYRSTLSLSDAKTKLKGLGYDNINVTKY